MSTLRIWRLKKRSESMSIPLYFQAIFNEEDEVLVDGGVTRNYPVDLFDHKKYLDNDANGEAVDYNPKNIS